MTPKLTREALMELECDMKLKVATLPNAGLQHARVFLEPAKAVHPWITYSDLWTLAGCVSIEAMGGPKVN